MAKRDKVIFVVGPTGIGKTDFSIELAKRIGGEIISSDSMQAYRRMDIISQKPIPKQKREVPHHLIDILDPREEYSAAEFVKRASIIINDIIERRKIPIVVGGSGLYVKALIDGLFPAPKKDLSFRNTLELEADENGGKVLHERLKKVDAEAASKIHPNDLRRIIRSLEVFHLTGIAISEQKKRTKGIKERFDIIIYGLTRPRSEIYKRIEDRVEKMFDEGLIEEVKSLKRKNPSITAKASLGYKEVAGYLEKKHSLNDAKELLKKNTRHLAKKQLTWFRADRRIIWVNLDGKSAISNYNYR